MSVNSLTCHGCGEDFEPSPRNSKYCQKCRQEDEEVTESDKREPCNRKDTVTAKEFNSRVLSPMPFTVIYDPLPEEDGGFSCGAKLGILDVEYGLKLTVFPPSMILKKGASYYRVRRTRQHTLSLEKLKGYDACADL